MSRVVDNVVLEVAGDERTSTLDEIDDTTSLDVWHLVACVLTSAVLGRFYEAIRI